MKLILSLFVVAYLGLIAAIVWSNRQWQKMLNGSAIKGLDSEESQNRH